MDGNNIGINDEKLTYHIDNLETALTDISNTLDKMSTLINESSNYSNDDIGKSIRSKFRSFERQFPMIKNNVNTTINELKTCKTKYIQQDFDSSRLFKNGI